MEITNVRIIKEAKAETSVARYTLEYIITNGLLERIVANVNKLMQDEDGNELYIGNITSENGTINCSLPASEQMALYFEDFEGFISIINADVAKLNKEK